MPTCIHNKFDRHALKETVVLNVNPRGWFLLATTCYKASASALGMATAYTVNLVLKLYRVVGRCFLNPTVLLLIVSKNSKKVRS